MTGSNHRDSMPPPSGPAGPMRALFVRVPSELLDALDAWREAQLVRPTKAEAVRVALARFLRSQGVPLRFPPTEGG